MVDQFLPFHAGELEAQRRAGFAARVAAIRDYMPDQHRLFFAQQRYFFVAAVDESGQPVATVLIGEPGFVSSPDDRTLRIATQFDDNDPAASAFRKGAAIGALGIEFETRRRNRANGVITVADQTGLTMALRESFGNCPQYIQARDIRRAEPASAPARAFSQLNEDARAIIAKADTFFVATSSGSIADATGGADISHRGGRVGFVRIDGDVLSIPDYRGNRYFNTLGNLVIEPRAALLFIDFESGDVLQLQGDANIDWRVEDDATAPDGAERLWRFNISRGWLRRGALPYRWSFREFSPQTERTGIWKAG